MTIPTFKKGKKLLAADLQTLADAVRANRILPGAGIRITGSPNGTTVAASIPRRSVSGVPSLHQVNFEDLVPNPFTVVQEVLDEVMDEFFAALPLPSAIASRISGIISEALVTALPTASQIANTIASIVISVITGAGSGGDIGALFNPLKTAVPNASIFATAILELFADAFDVLDRINEFVDEKFQEYVNVGELITDHFAQEGTKQPRPGDYLYTEEFGILYTLFPVDKETGVPSTNLIFRIHFWIGRDDPAQGQTRSEWCALTTFPAPDIAAICRMMARILRQVITQGINMAAAAAGGAADGLADTLAEGAERFGEGGAEGIAEGILDSLVQVEAVTPAGTGLLIKTFPTPIPTGDITERVYVISSDARQVAIRVFPTALYGEQLGSTAHVIGADGRMMSLGVFWSSYGQQLFTYPSLLGVDGQAHTVGVFGDVPSSFTPPHQIMYIGSDGQVWKTPHFFASTQQGITDKGRFWFIGLDGKGYSFEVPWFLGSTRDENLTCPKVNVIDTSGHDREIMVVGEPEDRGEVFTALEYLDNAGKPQSVDAIFWNGPQPSSGVTQEDIKVCEDGQATTKKFLIAPQ
jgi:hypothetical protein